MRTCFVVVRVLSIPLSCANALLHCERFGGGFLKRLSSRFSFKSTFKSFSSHYSARTRINEADKVSEDDLKALSSDEAHLRDVFFTSIWMMIGF